MNIREKVRVIGSVVAMVLMVLFLLGVPQLWWTHLTERPPGLLAGYVCSNARCAIRFETEVRDGAEIRCPQCMWLASPTAGEP
jgi:hypothetical protein